MDWTGPQFPCLTCNHIMRISMKMSLKNRPIEVRQCSETQPWCSQMSHLGLVTVKMLQRKIYPAHPPHSQISVHLPATSSHERYMLIFHWMVNQTRIGKTEVNPDTFSGERKCKEVVCANVILNCSQNSTCSCNNNIPNESVPCEGREVVSDKPSSQVSISK